MDAASFYTKWLGDLQADQMKNGAIPHVIPDILHQSAAAGWADAGVVIPYTVYLKYGDTRILKEHYESMKAWVNYMKNVAGDSCLWKKGAQFADWLSVSSTDKSLIATAYYAYSTSILQKTSAILGKKEDAAEYEKQFNKIKQAFQKEYISTGNHMMLTTQTADVMALAFNLVQDSLRKHIAENLDQDVKKSGHITTGFLGTPLISQVLTQNGYTDEAFLLLMNKKYPSWLYPVTMGATTIWERWDGIRPDGTFQDKGMNSFNHYAYGAIGNWLYSAVAGIELNPEEPGYKKFTINPHIGGNLTSAKASYQSVYGRIESGWQISNNEMTLTITVPPNTTAQVYLPSENKNDITESGKPLGSGSDLKLVEERGGQSVVEVGSGEYVFRVKMAGK
jgi:alpha-L-rhamnosidase